MRHTGSLIAQKARGPRADLRQKPTNQLSSIIIIKFLKMSKYIKGLLAFLQYSPTPYHCVENVVTELTNAGFSRLVENDDWSTLKKGKYFVTRNDSSVVAFNLQQQPQQYGFRMIGAHTDSPCLKLKPNAVTVNNGYAKFALEVYGGVLLNPWFDRDLSVAGRVTLQDKQGMIKSVLINVKEPIAFIPSLAIHLDREVNEHRSINKQKHLPAVFCRADSGERNFEPIVHGWISEEHSGLDQWKTLSFELSLYDSQPPRLVGIDKEFIASARLDNLLSCYAATQALISCQNTTNQLIVLNDHEEVGSGSTSGAEGTFLQSVLSRVCGSDESLQQAMPHSMMVSADNAHGIHPNYPEVHEPNHEPLMNMGPVIKVNSNQRYATNSETEALFKAACNKNKTPYQMIVVRSDMGCGSTIGPITATRLGVRTIDVGVPQLGMHSIRELAGVADQQYLVDVLAGFFNHDPWPF